MDYQAIQSELERIVEISSSLPQAYRTRCFEVLLSHFLTKDKSRAGASKDITTPQAALEPALADELPQVVQAFLDQHGISMPELKAVVDCGQGQVRFLREPTPSTAAQGQREWALLLALRNGLLFNRLEVGLGAIRRACKEKGCYDRANFVATFRRRKTSKLFSGSLPYTAKPHALSQPGQAHLAALIRSLGRRVD